MTTRGSCSNLDELQLENLKLRAEIESLKKSLAQSSGPSSAPCVACNAAEDFQQTCQSFDAEHSLSKDQVERYSRQLLLPQFGVAAQQRLCWGSVLVVGCGGLGSPVALYLAAAGVGRLGLVDRDVVEMSNLHRQVIHSMGRLGVHKALSAAATCQAINNHIQVVPHTEGLTPANAADLVRGYDVVVDASDNPATRYLVSDACACVGRPLVSGAAIGTDGQLTVYCHGPDGPCYRCLFPESPSPQNCGRCAEAGVLGVVPGVIGTLQALEAIKLLSGAGEPLSRRLLLLDALTGRFMQVKLRSKRPDCVVCGESPQIKEADIASYHYQEFTQQQDSDGPPVPRKLLTRESRISAEQLQELLHSEDGSRPLLLDVRPATQFSMFRAAGAVNIPYNEHFDQELPRIRELVAQHSTAQHSTQHTWNDRQHDMQQAVKEVDATTGNGSAVSRLLFVQHDKIYSPSAQHDNIYSADGQASAAELAVKSHLQTSQHLAAESHPGSAPAKPEGQQEEVLVICRRGNDSQLAVKKLHDFGIMWAKDVIGGYTSLAQEVDPSWPLI